MQFNWKKRLGAMLLTFFVIVGTVAAFPVFAADNIEIILEDVTASDPTTLSGEAKISVSVKGAVGNVTLVQTALKFSGNAKYKSIEFKQGKNDPGDGYFQIAPNAALVNSTGKLLPGIVAIKEPAMTFTDEKTEVFVLTFVGEPGETVMVGFDTESERSYCVVDNNEIPVQGADTSCEAKTSLDANEGIEAVVQLEMNKIKDFNTASDGDYADSKITLTITNETSGTTISTVLNNIPIKKGGHRDGGASIPTFIVKNTVISGDTYTVELMGPGYVSYNTTGYSFDRALELDNDDFIPGNVNMDDKVDDADKAAFKEVLGGNYENYGKDNADFNRSGEVNEFDNIFGNLDDAEEEPTKTVPEKMTKPTVSGGSGSITVKWEAPQNGGSEITGYVIKYGTSKNDLDKEVEIEGKSTKSKTITKLNDGKTYYVSIAAVNAIGTGEFSDVANAKTEDADDNGGGGGGGGGGGFGGGSTPSTGTGSGNTTPSIPSANEPFVDLGNHIWAKDSVYSLKNKGIISGISATEFAPANNIKRGDFILILTRMMSINDAFTENFADVPANMYYYNAIGSAKAAGIAQGNGNTFMPENTITRQDLITLAYRAFLSKGYIEETGDLTALDEFGDKDSISDYAKTAMASMVSAGIIKGADGNVNPLGYATRAEVAVMCARLLALMN